MTSSVTPVSSPIAAPVAKKVPLERTHHGDTFVDNYEWLREKDDPEVVAYLEAENAYTEQQTEHLAPLRETIFQEIKSRTQETDLSVPSRMGQWWYYSRSFEGKQYGVQCRCPITGPDDWTPPVLAADADDRGRAGAARQQRARRGARLLLPRCVLDQPRRHICWRTPSTPRRRAVHAAVQGPAHRRAARRRDPRHRARRHLGGGQHARLLHDGRRGLAARHRLAAQARHAQAEDVQVFHEPDERFWVGFGSTRSEKYLMIWIGSKITRESRMPRIGRPRGRVPGGAAAPRRRRVQRRARGRRGRGPVPDPAQRRRRRCEGGELRAGRGAGGRSDRPAHADRARARTSGWRTPRRSPVTWC